MERQPDGMRLLLRSADWPLGFRGGHPGWSPSYRAHAQPKSPFACAADGSRTRTTDQRVVCKLFVNIDHSQCMSHGPGLFCENSASGRYQYASSEPRYELSCRGFRFVDSHAERPPVYGQSFLCDESGDVWYNLSVPRWLGYFRAIVQRTLGTVRGSVCSCGRVA